MAFVEVKTSFPVELKIGFDYVNDPATWTEWYTHVNNVRAVKWGSPGDAADIEYKLLGRRIDATLVLEDFVPYRLVRLRSTAAGVPDVTTEWTYRGAGDLFTHVRAVIETEEPTSLFGRTVDRLVMPRALEQDLRRSLDTLNDIFVASAA